MLDLDQLNHLSDKDKEEYLNYERLFDSDGWRSVVEWAEAGVIDARKNVLQAKNWDSHLLFTGLAEGLTRVKNLEETITAVFTAKVEDAKQEAEDKLEESSE